MSGPHPVTFGALTGERNQTHSSDILVRMMFCPDCDGNLDEVPVGDPCPVCGGLRRSAIASPDAVKVNAIVGDVSLKVTKADHRPWTEKWLTVLNALEAFAITYSVDARQFGNIEIESRAMSFFVECDHLRDWLQGDIASLPAVLDNDIENHFKASMPLVVCNAICNTHKHHTRRSGITARIRETSVTPDGARVTVEIDWATPEASLVDGLDLAEDCVKSWRAFFASFGITEP